MPQKANPSPRSKRTRLERIDIDELFDSPSNRGMLSFLERAPEEARARLEERRKVDAAEVRATGTSLPRSNAHPLHLSEDKVDSVRESSKRLGGNAADESPTVGESPLGETAYSVGGRALPGAPAASKDYGQFGPEGDSSLRVESPSMGELPPGGSLPSVCGPPTVGDTPSVGDAPSVRELPTVIDLPPTVVASGEWHDLGAQAHNAGALRGAGELPSGGDLPTVGESPSGPYEHATLEHSHAAPFSNAEIVHPIRPARLPNISAAAESVPQGVLTPVGNSPAASRFTRSLFSREDSEAIPGDYSPHPDLLSRGRPASNVIDGTLIGRRQKIRRAFVAQDGHSSGEQLLYQALWNAAKPESGSLDRRIITIGYQGMSALCKLDKKNCKLNAKGLINKLALEVAKTYKSDERVGTTYRMFSYREILRKREEAGMVWVVRTSGVRFVSVAGQYTESGQGVSHPEGKEPILGTALRLAGGKSPTAPSNSPPEAVGDWSMGSVGASPPGSVGETPTLLGKERNSPQETSSVFPKQLGPKLRSVLPSFDDDAVRQLWTRCRQIAPNCTEEDVEYCFQIKAQQLLRGRKKIDNPVGIMIWSVPKTFEGPDPLYLRRRLEAERLLKAEEEERQRSRASLMEMLSDPRTSSEDQATISRLLDEQ